MLRARRALSQLTRARGELLDTSAVYEALCAPDAAMPRLVLDRLRNGTPGAFSDSRLLTPVLARLGRHRRSSVLVEVSAWMRSASVHDRMSYNAVIRGLIGAQTGSQSLGTLRLLEEMRADGFVPNRVSYTAAMCALASGAHWVAAERLSEEMRVAGFEPGVVVHGLVLDAMCRGGQLAPALRLLREMQATGMEPDLVSFCVLTSAAGRSADWDGACSLWDELLATHAGGSETRLVETLAGSPPAAHRRRALSACGAAACALERTGRWERALRLFSKLRGEGLAADAAAYNAAIRALGRAAPWLRPLQLELYEEMERLGLEPDALAHAAALRELERSAHRAAKATRVREAMATAGPPGVGESDWPPLRYGQQGGEQTKDGYRRPEQL